MKNLMILTFLWCCICACSVGGKVMTSDEFSTVQVGMTTTQLKEKYGKPYSIKNKGCGESEYLYIERINMGTRVIREIHYIIVVQNERVVSTKVEELSRPIYEQDSYEMQTQ